MSVPIDAADAAPLKILHIDADLVAIGKPAGLLVHRTALDAHEQRFAMQMLRDQIGAQVWPVHRLDKGSSGVLLFALNADVARELCAAFESNRLHKRYLALVRGWPSIEAGVIEHALARDPERASRGQTLLAARTDWKLLNHYEWQIATDPRFNNSRYALLEAQPHSGRRHQIRRHLKHIAHPIVGDATHGKGVHNRAVAQYLGLQRLWLHALELHIEHPVTRQALRLNAPLCPEWEALR